MYIDILKNDKLMHRHEVEDIDVRPLFDTWEQYVDAHKKYSDTITQLYLTENADFLKQFRGLSVAISFKSKIDQIPDDQTDTEPD